MQPYHNQVQFDAVVPQQTRSPPLQHQPLSAPTTDMYGNAKNYGMIPGNNMMPMVPNYQMYSPHPGMEMPPQYQQYGMQPGYDMSRASSLPASASRQNRKAQQQAKNSLKASAAQQQAQKRKAAVQPVDSDDDSDCDEGSVPDGPSAADIAKHKYNHIEDEKERKRLKRLLRNRVSAQQARERKKAYMSTLEGRFKTLEARSQELEQQVNKLERENFMLRQVVKNTTNKTQSPGMM